MQVLVAALDARRGPNDRVIYRAPFRWRNVDGTVISNCYEMFELEEVAAFLEMDIAYHFTHAAILCPRPTTGGAS